jgi:adenylosuccinate lyase
MAAVKAGVGRETAHEVIKKHAVDVALDMRERGADRNDLLDRLASDQRLGIARADLEALVESPITFTGAAGTQVAEVIQRVETVAAAHPEAAAYTPSPIL